ncbi:hypothetical protein YC2023_116169 [Brassica napus]
MTSPSIDTSTSTSIDTISCCRSTPLEIHDISSCPQYSADSTQKRTHVSCDLVPDVDREFTVEDFLELKDEAQSENLDQNLEKKPDNDQHTSEKDLETSPEASIDRHHPPDIDRYPPDYIDRYPLDDIDRHTGLDELSGYIVELEPIEERMHEPPILTEEAVGFHKRAKRIHDHVNIVVSCAVFEAESPIPPNRSIQFISYIEVLDDHQHVEPSQIGFLFRYEVDKGPAEATSIDTDRIPSNDTTDVISNEINKPTSIDVTTSPSIDTGRVSE